LNNLIHTDPLSYLALPHTLNNYSSECELSTVISALFDLHIIDAPTLLNNRTSSLVGYRYQYQYECGVEFSGAFEWNLDSTTQVVAGTK